MNLPISVLSEICVGSTISIVFCHAFDCQTRKACSVICFQASRANHQDGR